MLKDEKILGKLNSIIYDLFGHKINSWSFLGEGYISKVYKLDLENGKNIVVKFLEQEGVRRFEYPLEGLKSLVTSDLMMKNAQDINGIKSYGVYEIEGLYFHIMDFVSGKKMSVEDFENNDLVEQVAEKIAKIHLFGKEKIKEFNEEFKERYWKRSFREVFSNNETLLSVYEIWYSKSDYEELGWKIFNLMLKKYKEFIKTEKMDRLTILHGDFWYDNVIIGKNDVYFIDFSRIPYGDPAIDVGRFVGEAVLRYGLFEDKKWKMVVNKFLQKYIEITKDENVIRYIDISLLWVFYINSSPLVQQFLKWEKQSFEKLDSIIDNFEEFKKDLFMKNLSNV